MITGDVANFKAVYKARREFRRMLPDFEKDRQRNLQLAVDGGHGLPERIDQSLLLLYYAKGIKRFSALHFDIISYICKQNNSIVETLTLHIIHSHGMLACNLYGSMPV